MLVRNRMRQWFDGLLFAIFAGLVVLGGVRHGEAALPVLEGLRADPPILAVGTGVQKVTISISARDDDGDVTKVKLDQLDIEGNRVATLGELLDDGANEDATAGDGVFTLQAEFDTAQGRRIPLRITAKDVDKNKSRVPFSLLVDDGQASPPILGALIIDPPTIAIGDDIQRVTLSVQASDPDGDLVVESVEVSRHVEGQGTRPLLILVDNGTRGDAVAGDGRFTGRRSFVTDEVGPIHIIVNAKDEAGNQADPRGAIISVVDVQTAPQLTDLHVEPPVLQPLSGIQMVTISVRAEDPDGNLKNVKLDLLDEPGGLNRIDKLGKLLDDGVGKDAEAGDGIFTTVLEFDTFEPGPIPLRVTARDRNTPKNKMFLGFEVVIGEEGVPGSLAAVDIFGNTTVTQVGTDPRAGAVGDLNGDGLLDFVVANESSNTLSILLGDGQGGLEEITDCAARVGLGPVSVAIGDLNDDDASDLAVANSLSNDFSFLLNDGEGCFDADPTTLPAGTRPLAGALGHLNGDGILDFVGVNTRSNDISVLLGDGDGRFRAPMPPTISVGANPQALALADLDGDGILDVVVVNRDSNDVFALRGNGDGTFQAPGRFPVGSRPSSAAISDVNSDGCPDVAVTNRASDDVSLLLGSCDGAFQDDPNTFAVVNGPSDVAIGDLNDDRRPDLVVANEVAGNLSILLGHGDGTFEDVGTVAVGADPVAVVMGDFNGDGRPDVAAVNATDDSVSVLLNLVVPVILTLENNAVIVKDAAGTQAVSATEISDLTATMETPPQVLGASTTTVHLTVASVSGAGVISPFPSLNLTLESVMLEDARQVFLSLSPLRIGATENAAIVEIPEEAVVTVSAVDVTGAPLFSPSPFPVEPIFTSSGPTITLDLQAMTVLLRSQGSTEFDDLVAQGEFQYTFEIAGHWVLAPDRTERCEEADADTCERVTRIQGTMKVAP